MSILHFVEKRNVYILSGYLLVIVLCFYLSYRFDIVSMLPDNENLLNWDAYFFDRIVNPGYEYIPNTGTDLAFFPLFSYLWKALNVTSVGISIVNVLLFSIGFLLILGKEKLPVVFVLFLLSIPSFIFFAVPYSESLFFLFGALLIHGFRTDNKLVKLIGFLGISMVRAVSVILVPAIIVSEIITYDSSRSVKKKLIDAVVSSAASLAGLLIVASVQAYQTGQWFYFIGIQKYWGRHWILPEFPLTTVNAKNILGIDAIAFIIGVISIYLCAKWAYHFYNNNYNVNMVNIHLDHPVIFSGSYLSAIVILDVFFTAYSDGFTSIWSINRHLLCSPFFTVFIIWVYRSYKPDKIDLIFIGTLIIGGGYLTGVYNYPYMTLLYLSFFVAVGVLKFCPRYNTVVIFSVFINCAFQLIFYGDFLFRSWIG